MPAAHQQHQLVLEFLVGQPGGVLDQPRRDVVVGAAALERDQLHEGRRQFLVGTHRVLAVEDRRHGGGDGVADSRRAAEQLVEQQQRQQLGVVAQQVGPAQLAEPVDQVVGDRLHVTPDPRGVEPRQTVHHGLAEPQMHRAVGEQTARPVRHHRQHRAVQADTALVQGLPAAGVTGEQLRVLQHPQRHLVPDDQRGVHTGGELHRTGRGVFPQPVVDLVRIGGETGVVHGASARTRRGRGVSFHQVFLTETTVDRGRCTVTGSRGPEGRGPPAPGPGGREEVRTCARAGAAPARSAPSRTTAGPGRRSGRPGCPAAGRAPHAPPPPRTRGRSRSS